MIKIFKNINFIKKILNKKTCVLCVIKKIRLIFYKTHIYFKKKSLNLIYFNIYNLITFREFYNNFFFFFFLNVFKFEIKKIILKFVIFVLIIKKKKKKKIDYYRIN